MGLKDIFREKFAEKCLLTKKEAGWGSWADFVYFFAPSLGNFTTYIKSACS